MQELQESAEQADRLAAVAFEKSWGARVHLAQAFAAVHLLQMPRHGAPRKEEPENPPTTATTSKAPPPARVQVGGASSSTAPPA